MSGRFSSPKPRKSRCTPENERLVHETSMTSGSKRLVFQGVQYWQYPELFGGHDGNWWVFKSGRKPLNCKYTRLTWASLKTKGKSPLKINGWKMNLCISRWWFQTFFIFTPIPGEMIQFDDHIFQMGWNHQPEIAFSCQGLLGWVFLTSCGEIPLQPWRKLFSDRPGSPAGLGGEHDASWRSKRGGVQVQSWQVVFEA